MARGIRVSISANQLKKEIKEYVGQKVPPLTKNPELRLQFARAYGDIVTDYVPRSNEDGHHMQDYTLERDGRISWSRPARQDDKKLGIVQGQEIADLLYYDGPLRPWQSWQSRYNNHTPRNEWDKAVRPGTPDWNEYIYVASEIFLDWIAHNNG
jgi:hypothetical protein